MVLVYGYPGLHFISVTIIFIYGYLISKQFATVQRIEQHIGQADPAGARKNFDSPESEKVE